jgi:hypothetical protein
MACSFSKAPEAGAPEIDDLPADVATEAVEIVEEWENRGSDSALTLVMSLQRLFRKKGRIE